MSHSPGVQETTRDAIPVLSLEPKRGLPQRQRRGFLPRGWQDAMYAAIALFFLSLSACGWALALRFLGWHF